MKSLKYYISIILLLFVVSCSNNNSEQNSTKEYTIIDNLGNKISFEKVPSRIVTLSPNLTEMIYELGLGDKIIGNTTYCNYPEAANKTEKVATIITVDFEKLLKLSPDIIFLTTLGNKKDNYNRLKKLGFKVFVTQQYCYSDIKSSFRNIASVFHLEAKADSITHKWDEIVARVKKESEKMQPKKLMFLISLNPIMLAGKGTFIDELITMNGMENLGGKGVGRYPTFSREDILLQNPDYFFTGGNEKTLKDIIKFYPEWKDLNAIKNKKTFLIDNDLYFRPGPRFILALEDLHKKLQN